MNTQQQTHRVPILGVAVTALIAVSVAVGVGFFVWYSQSSQGVDPARCKDVAEGTLSVGRYDSPALIRIDNQPRPEIDNSSAPPVDGPVLICTGVGFFSDGYKAQIRFGMVNENSEVGFMYEQTGELERVQ